MKLADLTSTIYDRYLERLAKKRDQLLKVNAVVVVEEEVEKNHKDYDKFIEDFSYSNTKRAMQVYSHCFAIEKPHY